MTKQYICPLGLCSIKGVYMSVCVRVHETHNCLEILLDTAPTKEAKGRGR